MRQIIWILGLFGSMYSYAQKPEAALETPELNVLYRGYSNKIIAAVTNNADKTVGLLGSSNLEITRWSDSLAYSVIPTGNGRSAMLYVVLIDENSVDTVKTVEYRLSNLPNPTLFWGSAKSATQASIKEPLLFAKYPPEIPLNAAFVIKSWTIFHENDSISGPGSRLSIAEDFLKKIQNSTSLIIKAIAVGPDGKERKLEGQWKVVPWNEDKGSELIIIKCGG